MSLAAITLLLLVVAGILYITEIIPMAITSLSVAIALFLFGINDSAQTFGGLANNTIILFAGMFIIGGALFETGVAAKIGEIILKVSGTSEKRIVLTIMLVAAGLSTVLSNTSTTAVLMPVTLAVAASSGISKSKLLLPLALAAGLGGTITLLGTPPNLVIKGVIEEANLGTFSFFEFAYIGIPLTIGGILYMMFIGTKLVPDRNEDAEIADTGVKEAVITKEVDSKKQIIAVAVMLAAVLGMIFEKQIGVPLHVTSVIGALVIVITGVMSVKKAYGSIDWNTVFLYSGMLSLAGAMDRTGAGKMIADTVIGWVGTNASPYLITAALFLLTVCLTQFMNNTALTALLAPIGLVIANGLGADPKAVLMAIAIAASCAFATPIGTPPNTLILGIGGYRFMDYVKAGGPLVLVSFIISVIVIPIVWPFF